MLCKIDEGIDFTDYCRRDVEIKAIHLLGHRVVSETRFIHRVVVTAESLTTSEGVTDAGVYGIVELRHIVGCGYFGGKDRIFRIEPTCIFATCNKITTH